ncbi:MAG: nucleotidyl transferase AbiEii/AbiGii toxin family protein [Gemmatimonadetes bacterium]|nr:nucleotidyl transferase AbiEii/AbiGii toxin family protein [Gemmatimonadota bacterium]
MLPGDPLILRSLHIQILRIVGAAEREYGPIGLRLMGGTALSAYYLKHRESEDLDLFGGPTLNAKDFALFVRDRLERDGLYVHIREHEPLNQGFARYLVTEGVDPRDQPIRVDFGRESAFMLEPSLLTQEGVRVASFRDICAGKIGALCTRSDARDYIDLHAILRRPGAAGATPDDETVRQRMRSLLRDAQESDPGLSPVVVGETVARGLGRSLVRDFPLRLILPMTDEEVQTTLALALEACAREAGNKWLTG